MEIFVAPARARPQNCGMKRILIIEDDPLTAQIYRGCQEKSGYEVEVATDAQSGFDRLSQFRPEGLLLDLMLPNVSGTDLLKKIRATSGFENLPVIGFTNAFVPGIRSEERR